MTRTARAVAVVALLWLATSCTDATSADPTSAAPAAQSTTTPTFTPAFIAPPKAVALPTPALPDPSGVPATGDGSAMADGSTPPASAAPLPVLVVPVGLAGRVAALPVVAEAGAGTYDRDLFGGWIDVDSDGCHTRCEILEVERLPDGTWHSAYDDITTTDPSSFDIDHMVPLAEAWRSGASAWDPARRVAYANDLGNPLSLIAVSASSNRSKGDRDPASWMPPDQRSWCAYVDAWVTTKLTWGLSADPAEAASLATHAAAC